MPVKPPVELLADIEDTFGALASIQPIGGGDINHAMRATLRDGQTLFVKWISGQPSDFLQCEAEGLKVLQSAGSGLLIPTVLGTGGLETGLLWLALEYLEPTQPTSADWTAFAEGLAAMHGHHSDAFGLPASNYIGLLAQTNEPSDSWPQFFASRRLQPQLRLGLRGGVFGAAFAKRIDAICTWIDRLLPQCDPELMHGDLWSGNVMFTARGPALIDPSVAFGSGEADLAMAKLFGGFPQAFFEAYESAKPLEAGFAERIPIYQLYWMMVHANLFGGGYINQCSALAANVKV